MALPDELQERVDPLLDLFGGVWDETVEALDDIADNPLEYRQARRLRGLAEDVSAEMTRLADYGGRWAQQEIPAFHRYGFGQGAASVGAESWTVINTEAGQVLANGLTDNLLDATNGVDRSTKRLIRSIIRDQAFRAATASRTAVQAAREAERLLRANRVHAIRYADGSLHGLREYSEMAVRTVTGQAYNGAALSGIESQGVGFVEVLDGPGCGWTFHGDPDTALGKVVTVEEARSYPLAHPNCRRGFGARPDVTKTGRDGSVTPEQTLDQIRADEARAARLARRERTRTTSDPRGYRAARDGG